MAARLARFKMHYILNDLCNYTGLEYVLELENPEDEYEMVDEYRCMLCKENMQGILRLILHLHQSTHQFNYLVITDFIFFHSLKVLMRIRFALLSLVLM